MTPDRRAEIKRFVGVESARYWTTKQLRTAIRMRREGWTYMDIACEVRRSPDAVAARLRYHRERGQ